MKFKMVDYSEFNIEKIRDILSYILNIEISPSLSIEELYQLATDNDIDLNSMIWQSYKEIYSNDNVQILSHGSRNGIKGAIRLDINGPDNDFDKGFYCGQTLEQAGMFVSDEENSSLYVIKADLTGLKRAFFSVTTEWMLAVAHYRRVLGEYDNHPIIQKIVEKVDNSDYILAPIADNRVYEVIDEFLAGNITDKQCQFAISTAYLGYQYVFKKDKCLPKIEILEHLYLSDADKGRYNKDVINQATTSLNKSAIAKVFDYDDGKYVNEIFK